MIFSTQEVLHWFRFFLAISHAIYASDTPSFLQQLHHLPRGKGERAAPLPTLVHHLADPPRGDVLPAYAILVDHSRQEIILVARGTWSLHEILIAAIVAPEPFKDGFAHRGMLHMGKRLVEVARPELRRLGSAFPEYDVVITGHSLGAAAATVAAMELKPEFPSLKAVCFASPASLSAPLAQACAAYVDTVIHQHDFVPRLHLLGLERLRALLAEEPWWDLFKDRSWLEVDRIFRLLSEPGTPVSDEPRLTRPTDTTKEGGEGRGTVKKPWRGVDDEKDVAAWRGGGGRGVGWWETTKQSVQATDRTVRSWLGAAKRGPTKDKPVEGGKGNEPSPPPPSPPAGAGASLASSLWEADVQKLVQKGMSAFRSRVEEQASAAPAPTKERQGEEGGGGGGEGGGGGGLEEKANPTSVLGPTAGAEPPHEEEGKEGEGEQGRSEGRGPSNDADFPPFDVEPEPPRDLEPHEIEEQDPSPAAAPVAAEASATHLSPETHTAAAAAAEAATRTLYVLRNRLVGDAMSSLAWISLPSALRNPWSMLSKTNGREAGEGERADAAAAASVLASLQSTALSEPEDVDAAQQVWRGGDAKGEAGRQTPPSTTLYHYLPPGRIYWLQSAVQRAGQKEPAEQNRSAKGDTVESESESESGSEDEGGGDDDDLRDFPGEEVPPALAEEEKRGWEYVGARLLRIDPPYPPPTVDPDAPPPPTPPLPPTPSSPAVEVPDSASPAAALTAGVEAALGVSNPWLDPYVGHLLLSRRMLLDHFAGSMEEAFEVLQREGPSDPKDWPAVPGDGSERGQEKPVVGEKPVVEEDAVVER